MVRGFHYRISALCSQHIYLGSSSLVSKSYMKNKKLLMKFPNDYLMIVSSTTVIVLLVKRNNFVTISKNGTHFLQKKTTQLSLTRKE
jgi:hypothetical protein